jgi:predicted nuclease of predicted toxin-antitoxin system
MIFAHAWLLEFAEAESWVLVTLDKDFWQLAIQRNSMLDRSGVILFRASSDSSERHTACDPDDEYRA